MVLELVCARPLSVLCLNDEVGQFVAKCPKLLHLKQTGLDVRKNRVTSSWLGQSQRRAGSVAIRILKLVLKFKTSLNEYWLANCAIIDA